MANPTPIQEMHWLLQRLDNQIENARIEIVKLDGQISSYRAVIESLAINRTAIVEAIERLERAEKPTVVL